MANDLKIQNGKPVDENIRPIMVDRKTTALETAQSGGGAKVTGDLEVTSDITSGSDIKLNAANSIDLDSGSGDLFISKGGYLSDKFALFDADSKKYRQYYDASNYLSLDIEANGVTTLSTLDYDGAVGHLTLAPDGSIILNSASGGFEMHGGGTTAKFADMYAGMILGYTVIGLDETPASFDVTNAMLPVHDDLKVSFVFPPSGKVEIMASIYVQTDASRPLAFGLSTTDASTGFTSLGAKYENHTLNTDETDGFQHTHRWYVTGTAGDSEELWFAAGCTHTNRYDLFWGGDSSSVAVAVHPMEYQPFVMKATALPATIYTG